MYQSYSNIVSDRLDIVRLARCFTHFVRRPSQITSPTSAVGPGLQVGNPALPTTSPGAPESRPTVPRPGSHRRVIVFWELSDCSSHLGASPSIVGGEEQRLS